MGVGFLDGVGRVRGLFLEQALAPEGVRVGGVVVVVVGGRRRGRAGEGSSGRGRGGGGGRRGGQRGGEVFLVDGAPVLPFLHDFLAVEQHAAEEDAGGPTAAFLPVVVLQAFAHFERQGAVEVVLEFVEVVLRAAGRELVVQFRVVGFGPAVDAFPAVRDGRRGRQAFLEGLHLDLARGDGGEGGVVVGGGVELGGAHAGGVGCCCGGGGGAGVG